MATKWTYDQVIAMAPDAPSVKTGQKLADPSKWTLLAGSDVALWGEAKGSGKNPYQVRIDVSGPAFKCSCPSRKFPCKHALGLALISATKPESIKQGSPPEWVSEWLESRSEREQKKTERKNSADEPVDEATAERRAKAQEKRAAKRQDNIAAGIVELDQRLKDVVRHGLASQQADSARNWNEIAARMVDAQAPGLARMVRDLADTLHGGAGWQSRFLNQMARCHLLLSAYKRRGELPPENQADIDSRIGLTQSREKLLQQEGVKDVWRVLGKRLEHEGPLRVQRSWLQGTSTGRYAMLLDFAAGNQPMETGPLAGGCINAELVFYPGAYPLRALIKSREPESLTETPNAFHFPNIINNIEITAEILATDPWTTAFPVAVGAATIAVEDSDWKIIDDKGNALPLLPGFEQRWNLLAVCGGIPLPIFGEWDGLSFRPLSAFAPERVLTFGDKVRP